MKTAEEILRENFELDDWSSGFKRDVIDCMKEYAKEVAQDLRTRASENATAFMDSERIGGWWRDVPAVNQESITETEIITP